VTNSFLSVVGVEGFALSGGTKSPFALFKPVVEEVKSPLRRFVELVRGRGLILLRGVLALFC